MKGLTMRRGEFAPFGGPFPRRTLLRPRHPARARPLLQLVGQLGPVVVARLLGHPIERLRNAGRATKQDDALSARVPHVLAGGPHVAQAIEHEAVADLPDTVGRARPVALAVAQDEDVVAQLPGARAIGDARLLAVDG